VITRRQALVAASVALATRPALVRADTGSDAETLTALVAYAQEVVFGYDVTLTRAPLAKVERMTLQRFRRDAASSVAALRSALVQAGGTPPVPPDPRTAPPPSSPPRRGYLEDLITAENALVARYYTAFQELTGQRHITRSAAFMAAAGRRLVVLRDLVGDQLLPRSFETGSA
jgi:hypothetical protein